VKSWGGVLESSYIAHFPPPWFRNYGKRVVKSPKFYFYDFALVTLLMRQPDVYFWRSHDDLEVDLLIVIGGKLQSVEIKLTATLGWRSLRANSPSSGKSWDGNLDHLVSGMTTGGTATMPR
jgi:uncharacterized protein